MDEIIEMNEICASEILLCVECGLFAGFKLEMHEIIEILLPEFLSVLMAVKLIKQGRNTQNLRIPIQYLAWCEMHKFLSSVFYSCGLPENLLGVL